MNAGDIFKLIRRMVYEDSLAEFNLSENKVDVMERLLAFLASSKLGEFSYTSFSNLSGYGKSTVYDAVKILLEIGILCMLEEKSPKAKANGTVKILFSHPNIRNAFASEMMMEADRGALREEYFVFHARNLELPISIPKKGKKNPDYEVKLGTEAYLAEIGGPSKGKSQFESKKGLVFDDVSLIVMGFVQKTDRK